MVNTMLHVYSWPYVQITASTASDEFVSTFWSLMQILKDFSCLYFKPTILFTPPSSSSLLQPSRRQLAILDLLEDVVGSGVRNYVDFSQRDWSREPYNGGCFLKSLMPGTTKYFNNVLREPVDRFVWSNHMEKIEDLCRMLFFSFLSKTYDNTVIYLIIDI